MQRVMRWLIWVGVLVGVVGFPAGASPHHIYQVFVERSSQGNTAGQDNLQFVNLVTGDVQTTEVYGTGYTVAGDTLLYFDRLDSVVRTLTPDGTISDHPFIQPSATTRRIDWVVSPNQARIAWTLTEGGSTESLTTTTTVANLDGTQPLQVLVDGPRDGIRALPVAFDRNLTTLYMDYQPDGLGDFTPFSQYAGLFAVDVVDANAPESVSSLPNEPGCYCGAGFGAGLFLRLDLAASGSGFDLAVNDLTAQTTRMIDALSLRYTQGGDILISPDGTQAVYTLAQIRDFGTSNQSVVTALVLVDLETMTQRAILNPLYQLHTPVAWTENNSTVILTRPGVNGTWKLDLSNARLEQIANATYLGEMTAP
jgi:hypothetical protein